MVFAQRLLLAFATVALIVPMSGQALAGGQVGQYLIGTYRYDSPNMWNPTDVEAIAVAFHFNAMDDSDTSDDQGDIMQPILPGLRACDYVLVPSKGTNQDIDLEEDEDTSVDIHRGFFEVLAVPTTGKLAGKIKSGYGVGVRKRSQAYLAVMDVKNYKKPRTEIGRQQVEDCICDSLSDAALPGNLFTGFGYNCS